ncbi:suppressor of fused domain protein [Pseudarthrobacter sp. CC12]|uniref:suppressor of fused domain protein n=1 Tax=Pseudarthrobacter sp. CC12 TaxID=3029193 RepID=UPI003262D88A
MDSVDAVDAHYRKCVGGEPEYVRFAQDRRLIGLLEWPNESSKIGLHIYATFGLHALVHGNHPHGHGHGFEIFAAVDAGTDEFRRAFAMMANDLIMDQTFLRPGETVTYENSRIIEGLQFTSWLMLESYDDLLPDLALNDGGHVVFMYATPIFREEAQYLRENGLEALFDVWEKDNPRLEDLGRGVTPSLC